MNVKKLFKKSFLLCFSVLLFCVSIFAKEQLHTIYGDFEITEPVLCELLQCPTMQRLKGINQYGANAYLNSSRKYTRYTHSIGVMVLLRNFGAPEPEQIAGLLHDVSHTVFSHAGGFVFTDDYKKMDSHQDEIHEWFLKQTEIVPILEKYGYTIQDIHHKNKHFTMLEQDLPDICADRLEYNLYGGYIEGLLTEEEVRSLVAHLRYNKGAWFFVDEYSANLIARVSCYLTENVFSAPWDSLVNRWTGSALKRAVDIGLITINDIHFSVDDLIWNKLCNSDDEQIKKCIIRIMHYDVMYQIVDEQSADILLKSKSRCIDPLVKKNGLLYRLSKLDTQFADEVVRIKDRCTRGNAVSFTKAYAAA